MIKARHRPVNASADFLEVRNVVKVPSARIAPVSIRLLFDPETHLSERVLKGTVSS